AYRSEKVSGFVPTEFQTGWAYGNFLPTHGSDSVSEAYIETVVPLGLGVEVNGAVRGINYSRSGFVTAWKLGATWQPIPDILVRATQSRDIREPNLSELYATGTSRTNNLTDPFTGLAGVRFFETTVGNPNLRPEQGDSTTAGVVFRPRAIPGLSVSSDWFQSRVKDAIAAFSAQDIINLCYLGNNDFCSAYGPDPSGVNTYAFQATRFNASAVKVSGIDFAANYRLNIGDSGRLSLNANGTRYLEYRSETGIPQDQVINTVGQLSGSTPTWSYRATLTYDTPTWAATIAGRGVSSGKWQNNYVECRTNCPVSTVDNPTIDVNHASAPIYVDANLRFKIDDTRFEKAEFFIHVSNLFNSDPIMLPI
ncbi:MAG: TonB-dependent receptor, partial [Rhizobiaceae bacterium]